MLDASASRNPLSRHQGDAWIQYPKSNIRHHADGTLGYDIGPSIRERTRAMTISEFIDAPLPPLQRRRAGRRGRGLQRTTSTAAARCSSRWPAR